MALFNVEPYFILIVSGSSIMISLPGKSKNVKLEMMTNLYLISSFVSEF